MPISAEEFLKIPLEELIAERQEEIRRKEEREDAYYAEISKHLDEHPIDHPGMIGPYHNP